MPPHTPRIATFGEIMLRLSTLRHQRFRQARNMEVEYGGGESNVAVSLANYGRDVRFVSRLPDNDLGDCAIRTLRAAGIDTSHVVRGGKRLGIYFLETGAIQRPSKAIYDREDSSMATVAEGDIDWDAALAGVDWFHWSGIRARKIVTTLRGTISASHNTYTGLLWDGQELHASPTYQLTHIVDRVGGGDSFMGGLIHGLLKWPEDPTMALRFGVAASALKHTIPGDVNLVSEAEVVALMEGDGSGRVRR